jgi:hypothetical protein
MIFKIFKVQNRYWAALYENEGDFAPIATQLPSADSKTEALAWVGKIKGIKKNAPVEDHTNEQDISEQAPNDLQQEGNATDAKAKKLRRS